MISNNFSLNAYHSMIDKTQGMEIKIASSPLNVSGQIPSVP